MSTFLIVAPNRSNQTWEEGMKKCLPDHRVEVWPNVSDPEAVTGAACWNHPHGSLNGYKNLKLISSMGAGVDHILSDPDLPAGVPVTRIVDEALTYTMTRYLLAVTLSWHRRLDVYQKEQKEHVWHQKARPDRPLHIGIMGLGVLGKDIAGNLAGLGFDVKGYSRSPKQIEGVRCYAGEEEMDDFLKDVNFLINLLPLTSDTKNMLDKSFFDRLPHPICLVNAARGGHLVEEDLLTALDEGKVEYAFLDVFRKEPLPEDHPFWDREDILITPHIASITNIDAAIPQIAENWLRAERGDPLRNEIDRSREY